MTAVEETSLAANIERLVHAVPGVAAVYRTGGIVATIATAAATAVGIADDAPRVQVSHTAAGTRVEIAIGVHAATGAADTVRAVHDRVADWLAHRGDITETIRITVVHVDDSPSPDR